MTFFREFPVSPYALLATITREKDHMLLMLYLKLVNLFDLISLRHEHLNQLIN